MTVEALSMLITLGLLLNFKFNRRRLPMHAIEACVYDETNMVTDFLQSEAGSRAKSAMRRRC